MKIRLFLAILLLVSIGGCSSSGGGTSSPATDTAGPTPSAITSASGACITEVLAGADIEINNGDQGIVTLEQAIGSQTPIFQMSNRVMANFTATETGTGIESAKRGALTAARQARTDNSNPVLNADQLQGLQQVASGTDADALSNVAYTG